MMPYDTTKHQLSNISALKKMAAVSQMTFANKIPLMKIIVSALYFTEVYFLGVNLK